MKKLLATVSLCALLGACSTSTDTALKTNATNLAAGAATLKSIVVTVQPYASDIACQAQAAANATSAGLTATHNAADAATTAQVSVGLGLLCNGLAAGATLPTPVSIPVVAPATP